MPTIKGIAVGTRPDQDSDTVPARLREGFNSSSVGQPVGGGPVQSATPAQEKAQPAADTIEEKEVQALLHDTGGEAEVSVGDVQGSKTRRLDIRDKIQRQRWWRLYGHILMRQAIEAALEKVQALIEFHQSQMDALAELIKLGRDSLAELLEQKLALMEEIDRFRETGRFDMDENGRFRNERARQALAGWEEKTGVQIDLHNPSSYLGVMEAVKDIEDEEAETKAGIERDEQDYRYHKTKRDEAVEIKGDLESGDSIRVKNALQRLEKLGNDQRFGTAENSLTSEAGTSNNQKNQILRQMELTGSDLAQDGFSFNFPPLQADFNRSVTEDRKENTKKEPGQPKLKTTLPGHSMR